MNAVITQSQVPARSTSRTVRKSLAIALGALALACSGGAAQAQSHGGFHGGGFHGGGWHGGGGGWHGGGWGGGGWAGPAIIGGLAAGALLGGAYYGGYGGYGGCTSYAPIYDAYGNYIGQQPVRTC